ncbi:Na/Pi symporter [Alteromonas australica]|jgi:solute carrier family 34 (sodium-dependent phosphate cotransporter)|uniref:Sodium:phosphate symporter n=1 Tax=Alteromonas australica TaxID=589873 RepID=A0A075P5E6_9ALTE|nr:Na/Pi symporter [Alteromonas australica]MBU35539.1 sodium:phosphate symporter [Alteromonas sp.]AIG00151.1 sodium:phosphate symporter [Alteromonas australica]HAI73547.1 sodium:phosphate symporter [Alteromonas australica]HAU27495.1 sodium:phosphate symporter [Alteromonas australica]HBU50147.1 sodium:phosphate symporter [Alteromonas australica]|tara:strand:+ start:6659 stop:7810 length:1152 start_codon:yes stop_codon:yes gene_type:complete
MSVTETPFTLESESPQRNWMRWLLLAALVYVMLVAVSMIGSGFKVATGDHAKELFSFASNPIMGLIIGMVATALIQSSSTVTSIIVGMVAGGLPITIAIPMMMGANIGTSITNTLVSLGHVARKDEFQRAFNAATIHDFFNVMSVLIFLPLEMAFGVLEYLSGAIVALLDTGSTSGMDGFNPIKAITQPALDVVSGMLSALPSVYPGVFKILIGIGLIVLSITYMGRIMKSLMVGKAKEILHRSIGKGPLSGITSGALMTVLVQSSSTTTSLVVPLVGSGILKAKDIYPFTLGANVGTCITALIAALGVVGVNAGFALQIAIVHLLYNVIGVTLIYGLPMLRNIPLDLSYKLSVMVADTKLYGVAYIGGLFFCMPLGIIFASV